MSVCTDSPPPPPRLAEGRRWQPGTGRGGRAQPGGSAAGTSEPRLSSQPSLKFRGLEGGAVQRLPQPGAPGAVLEEGTASTAAARGGRKRLHSADRSGAGHPPVRDLMESVTVAAAQRLPPRFA